MIASILFYVLGSYVLGSLTSLALCYVNNRREYCEKTDLDVALFICLFSWISVVVLLVNYGYGSDWFWRMNKTFRGE
jgi:hypothetical protein